jgi:segregation and condensation protein A
MTSSTGMAGPEIVGARPAAPTAQTPMSQFDTAEPRVGFEVHLDVFEGPFDLLLGLIAKHELDITAVSLSTVTDEFIAFIRAMGAVWDLDRASEFLVIAATLVDLKAARLLPAAEVEDEDDLALLEARDLLFARLLQYRAYKEVAAILARTFAAESRRYPRSVGPEPGFAGLLPEVLLGLGPQQFADLAARALAPRPRPVVSVAHLHTPTVSVREQLAIVSERLRHSGTATFRSLTADCTATVEIVARFLALLDLFRDGLVAFEQVTALGDLLVRWTRHDEPVDDDQLAAAATGESARFVDADPAPSAADAYGQESHEDRVPDSVERP